MPNVKRPERGYCDNCDFEITSKGIECLECPNGEYMLCEDCFLAGCISGEHKPDHKYRLYGSGSLGEPEASQNAQDDTMLPCSSKSISNLNNPLLQRLNHERVRLIDAIEHYGFRNWQDVINYVDPKLYPELIKYFLRKFCEGKLGEFTWNTGELSGASDEVFNVMAINGIAGDVPKDQRLIDLTSQFLQLKISKRQLEELEYVPDRDEYGTEFDDEVEEMFSRLALYPNEEEVETDTKVELLDTLARRLRERERRKKVVKEYGLIQKFFEKRNKDKAIGKRRKRKRMTSKKASLAQKEKVCEYEEDLKEKLQPFGQFQSSKEQSDLIAGLVLEKELKFHLRQLLEYRKAGLTKFDEVPEYEKWKRSGNTTLAVERSLGTVEEMDTEPPADTENVEQGTSNVAGSPCASSSAASLTELANSAKLAQLQERKEKLTCREKSPIPVLTLRFLKMDGKPRKWSVITKQSGGRDENDGNNNKK